MEEPNVSLEKRFIKHCVDGIWKKVPCIDATWVTERAFPCYIAPPTSPDGSIDLGAKNSWKELVSATYSDLLWLLNVEHHVFWSQMIFNKKASMCLTSFLQEAPPVYCQNKLPDDVKKVICKLSRVVFLVLKRMTIPRENEENFISPHVLGDILYENYLFTVPSLLDICVVYGGSNAAEAGRLIENVMCLQRKYLQDFSYAVPHLDGLVNNATTTLAASPKVGRAFTDMIVHVYDSLVTTRIFLQVYPKGCEIFGSPELLLSIASFYTTVMPILKKSQDIHEIVSNLRVECLKFVRTLMESVLSDALESQSAAKVEHYLSLISEIMSEGLFICDFHALHPIDTDLAIIQGICPDIDQMKIDYLLEALASHVELKLKKLEKAEPVNHVRNYDKPTHSRPSPAPSGKSVTGVELISLISQVKDLLPHLGEGYIEECLKYYDFDAEKMIAAVLESTLPPTLEELNWEKQRAAQPEVEDFSEEPSTSFTVIKGKKPRGHKNINQLLSDKREINEMKDKFAGLGLVEDEYDDEYDDTYDSVDVAVEPDAASSTRRPYVTPRILRPREVVEEEEDESEEEAPSTIKKDHFVPNPEELRERAEQKRAQRGGWNRNVVGRAKGQGQDKEVLQNREKKNVHKSSVGNHHRRDRASQKRNKGMFPS